MSGAIIDAGISVGSFYHQFKDKSELLIAILEDHDMILYSPEPLVKLHTLNDSSVDFVVRPWVMTDDYWDVYWDVTREVKIRFDAEKISIPFPQRDVHVFKESADESA